MVTNDEAYAKRMRVFRDQGQSRKYHHDEVGYNYRMDGIQGAVLRVKLRHLDDWNAARRGHAARYRELLADAGLELLEEKPWGTPVYHIFPVFTPERDALQKHLERSGVSSGIHYPTPVHEQPAYRGSGRCVDELSNTCRAARETLSLPMYAELPGSALERAADAVRDFQIERSKSAS